MSGGLAPSKTTVYVSNLPFSLTNNDLHKIFEKYGKVVKVTVMKDRVTRLSKGVAFVLYLERESAHKCVQALHQKEMFSRTIKCNIAHDNGRAADFIRRKTYKDKSRCYECGEEGHLSYACPSNLFGERKPPEKKKRKKNGDEDENEEDTETEKRARFEHGKPESEEEEDDEGEDLAKDSLAAAIQFQQSKEEEDDYRYRVATGDYTAATSADELSTKKTFKKDSYFSDEEELDG